MCHNSHPERLGGHNGHASCHTDDSVPAQSPSVHGL